MHKSIAVASIHPNPHRDFEGNPLREEQIAAIVDSIGRTGFWDNVVVRPHPELKGEYQLAYGHNRLEAVKQAKIKEVTLPVRNLSDWDMYCAMVDENETQETVTVAVAFENVRAGVRLLEKAFQKIGEEGTWKEYNQALQRSPVEISTGLRDKHDGHFEVARNAFFRGAGIGRVFVKSVLPGSRLHDHTISDVLSSIYGTTRAESKARQAKRAERIAKREEQRARVEKDKVRAAKRRQKANEMITKASRLREEAKTIGEGCIAQEILRKLENTYQMRQFTAAIKAAKVPKSHHQAALDHLQKKGITAGGPMIEEISRWWYRESGEEEKQAQHHQKRERDKRFQLHIKEGDFRRFLTQLLTSASRLNKDISLALPAAPYYDSPEHRTRACEVLSEVKECLEALLESLTGPAQLFPEEGVNGRFLERKEIEV